MALTRDDALLLGFRAELDAVHDIGATSSTEEEK